MNTWLRGTTDSLTTKTFELLLFLIIILILRRFKPEQQPRGASQNHQLPKLCLHNPAETERRARHPPSRGADMCSTLHRQAGSESSRSTQSTQREGAANNGTRERGPHVHDSYQPNRWKNPWDPPRFSRNPKDKNNWKPNQTSKGNRLTHPRATRVGKRQRNPPQHHSDMHSAEYAQEQYSLPSEDMEQVTRQLNEFLQDKLNTDDYKIESCSL